MSGERQTILSLIIFIFNLLLDLIEMLSFEPEYEGRHEWNRLSSTCTLAEIKHVSVELQA